MPTPFFVSANLHFASPFFASVWASNLIVHFLLIAAVSCGVTHDGQVFLDPTKLEEQVYQHHSDFETLASGNRSHPFKMQRAYDFRFSKIGSNDCLFGIWQKSKAFVCLVFPSRPRSAVPGLPADVDGEPVEHGILTSVTRGAMEGQLHILSGRFFLDLKLLSKNGSHLSLYCCTFITEGSLCFSNWVLLLVQWMSILHVWRTVGPLLPKLQSSYALA